MADFGQRADPRFGLICVDIFTKKLAVVPVPNKLPKTTSDAFQKVVDTMDIPASIMTDEGGEWKNDFSAKLSSRAHVGALRCGLICSRVPTFHAR